MNSANVMGPWSRIAPRIASATCSLMARSMPPSTPGRNPGVVDELRLAASVVAGRDGAGGLELLVIERSRSGRFLPGLRGVPGRRHRPGRRRCWLPSGSAPRTRSRARAPIRELSEETALVVTVDGMGPIGSWDPLQSGGDGATLRRPAPEIAHWIAPEEVPGPVSTRATTRRSGSTAWSRRPTDPRPHPRGGPPRRSCSPSTRPARGSSTGRRTSR